MKEIGNKLRDAREKKNLSIQDVSTATKINIKTIQSIEDGDLDSLPAKPFLRGFIQTYAKYLELDVDNIMKQFLEIQGSTKPRPLTTEELVQTEQSNHEEIQKRVELYKKVAYAVAALLAIVLIYVIHKVVSRYEAESKNAREQKEAMKSQLGENANSLQSANGTMQPPPPPEAPKDEATDAAKTTAAVAVPEAPKKEEPKKEEVKKEEPKKEEAKKPELPKKEEPKKEEVKKPEPPKKEEPKKEEAKKPETPKKEEPKKEEVKKPEAPKKEEPKKDEPKVIKKSKPQEVIVEALDNVEIHYVKDGEGEKTVRLKPEQVLTIRANANVSLDINDSGAVNIIHNGQDKGVPGSLGQSTKINYP